MIISLKTNHKRSLVSKKHFQPLSAIAKIVIPKDTPNDTLSQLLIAQNNVQSHECFWPKISNQTKQDPLKNFGNNIPVNQKLASNTERNTNIPTTKQKATMNI